jgi:hypothetical protein
MDQQKYQEAIAFLRTELDRDARALRRAIKRDPTRWHEAYHHFWGRMVRIKLRDHGFGEDALKVANLEDIYAKMVEEAVAES